MVNPREGDKILVLKYGPLQSILIGDKTMEIRCKRLKPGTYFLGHRGMLYGSIRLSSPQRIATTDAWAALRHEHCVQGDALFYATTFGIRIFDRETFSEPIPYRHLRGAIGIARYRQ